MNDIALSISPPTFVHLHLHTAYSIVDSLIRVEELVDKVSEMGMPAVAVTDQNNLFAMVKFYRAAQQMGIKPIVGADIWLRSESSAIKRSRLVLLCQNTAGYRNLVRLITRSYTDGRLKGTPHIRRDWINQSAEGLIALSGGSEGEIGKALLGGRYDEARRSLEDWLALFPNRFYLMVHRSGRAREEEYIEQVVELAGATKVPLVATNEVCFINGEDFEAHQARVCINDGHTLTDPRRPQNYTQQQYLRTPEEMIALFDDLPEAIDNAVLVAQRCNLELKLGQYHLPEYPVPEHMSIDALLREQVRQGMERRIGQQSDKISPAFREQRQAYDSRLETELDVITKMGFSGYFLIVADFVRWAKANAIPVGPGRGSGAGSLAAYALGITDLDPLGYDLLFERFLNPERVSMPDFDVDFCMERRDEVIDYVARRYGRDRVSQIITHGTMAARAVVRDVGRVLGYPYGFVDQVAKLVPLDLNMTLERALKQEPMLQKRYAEEDDVRSVIDLARKLEGLARNAGKHAGGVVIAPAPLTEFMPLYREQGTSTSVTQFDMSDVEAIGLVKFDFLGLRTLTIIDWAVRDINRIRKERGESFVDIGRISLADTETFELICRAETTAVFQLESRGIKDLIRRLQPDVFEDLVALVALFRPGPLQSGMVDDFIARKRGKARVTYPHQALEHVLKPTYGVILYQEQVMQIAQILAGYTLGEADLLRRAMGKKKPDEMAKQRAIFTQGARDRGVDEAIATGIFDLMEKFAGYGFNKSHSVAYALIAYQTAWLKAHYPAAFMAAVLSSDMDNSNKVIALIDECRRLKICVLPPDVNTCVASFAVKDERSIRYGLGAVKGVGESAIEAITEERDKKGRFEIFFDLCYRVDPKKVNRRVLEALIRAGALDSLHPSRSSMTASLAKMLRMADQDLRNRAAGQNDLFGWHKGTPQPASNGEESVLTKVPAWSEQERLAGEKQTLGLYLSGHPIDRYEKELAGLVSTRLMNLRPGHRRVAGLVTSLRVANTKRGRMAVAVLDDNNVRVEVVVYEEVWRTYGEYLREDRLVIVEGNCGLDEFTGSKNITADRLLDIEQARARFAKRLVVSIDSENVDAGFVEGLERILGPYRNGPCPVAIDYRQPAARARLQLGKSWGVQVPDALIERLTGSFGKDSVVLEYS